MKRSKRHIPRVVMGDDEIQDMLEELLVRQPDEDFFDVGWNAEKREQAINWVRRAGAILSAVKELGLLQPEDLEGRI
jgi:hypothetical protein